MKKLIKKYKLVIFYALLLIVVVIIANNVVETTTERINNLKLPISIEVKYEKEV